MTDCQIHIPADGINISRCLYIWGLVLNIMKWKVMVTIMTLCMVFRKLWNSFIMGSITKDAYTMTCYCKNFLGLIPAHSVKTLWKWKGLRFTNFAISSRLGFCSELECINLIAFSMVAYWFIIEAYLILGKNKTRILLF